MSENQIGDEAAFCRAIDINPDVVKAGSLQINMQGGQAVVQCVIMLPVTHERLAHAMLAAAGQVPQEGPRAVPEDHKPPAQKAAARKTPAKKAPAKKRP
jgi:hypothetical protein